MVHTLVPGAGPTGLMTAMMLAVEGHRVTVLDRDPSPPKGGAAEIWSGWKRPGVRQFPQPHLLLPGGHRLLAAEFPRWWNASSAWGEAGST